MMVMAVPKPHLTSRPTTHTNQVGYMNYTYREDSRARGRAKSSKTTAKDTPRPSELFDWDAAILRFKAMMKELGYK